MAFAADEVDPNARNAMAAAFDKIASQSPFAPLSQRAYETLLSQQPQNRPVSQDPPQLQSSGSMIQTSVPAAGSNLLANLDQSLQAAATATDSQTAFMHLSNIKGEIAKESARFEKEAQSQAEAEFQVPRLMEALQQSIQMDDASLGFRQKYGNVDSAETEAVRLRFQSAKAAASAAVNEKLKANGTYRELMARSETTLQAAAHTVQKFWDKEANLESKATMAMLGMPPEEKVMFEKATGTQGQDIKTQFAVMARVSGVPGQEQQLEAVMKGGERAVPQLALTGNIFAKKVLLDNEASVFGSKDVAVARIAKVEEMAKDPKLALAAFTEMKNAGVYGSGPEVEAKKTSLSALLSTSGAGNKEQRQEASFRSAEIAKEYAAFKMQKEFDGDIVAIRGKSKVPMPIWLEAASQDPKVGKITKEVAMKLVHDAPTVEGQRARAAELVAYYDSARETQNRSMIFSISPLATDELKARMHLGGILGTLGRGLGNVAELAGQQGKQSIDQWSGTANLPFNLGAELLTSDDPFSAETLRRGFLRGQPFGTGAKK